LRKEIRTETVYQEIIKTYLDKRRIEAVAAALNVSEVKVRKVLITEGLWSSPTSTRVKYYYEQGITSEKIAELLHTTVKAVQQYMPYSKGIYRGDYPSEDARYSAEYRERIRIAKENVLKKNREIYIEEGWETMNGESETKRELQEHMPHSDNMDRPFILDYYPGQVCLRSLPEGMVDWDKARCTGVDVIRLHLELRRDSFNPLDTEDDGHQRAVLQESDYYEEETRVLKTYGHVQYGETISRDILVPSDMPLYALHYAIQRLFGWQNSHLHRYELPAKKFISVTGNRGENWLKLIGVLFQSPLMREEDHFWADDYEYGSFKTWLRKKYTGPYTSLCHGEGLIQCTKDVRRLKKEYPLFDVSYVEDEGKLSVSDIRRAKEGSRPGEIPLTETDQDLWGRKIIRRETVRMEECDVMGMVRFFAESGANNLLERMTLDDVLALHGKHPDAAMAEGSEICDTFERFMDEDTKEDIRGILKAKIDHPDYQPMTNTPTDVLYYYYDYGDDWRIRITGSYDACDLIEQGRLNQQQLDEAIAKVHMTYRPVCIAADGVSLVDDAGGLWGFVQFLRSQHPREEAVYWGKESVPDNGPYEEKQESLTWAKGLGWTDNMNHKRML